MRVLRFMSATSSFGKAVNGNKKDFERLTFKDYLTSIPYSIQSIPQTEHWQECRGLTREPGRSNSSLVAEENYENKTERAPRNRLTHSPQPPIFPSFYLDTNKHEWKYRELNIQSLHEADHSDPYAHFQSVNEFKYWEAFWCPSSAAFLKSIFA